MKQKNKFLQGFIKRHPDGFGFFIPDDHEHADVYIPKHSMENIMTNDRVMVQVFAEKGGDRFHGEILRILSRGTKSVVGIFYQLNSTYGFIKDENRSWGSDLTIPLTASMNAKTGDLVAADITKYPEDGQEFQGQIKDVIGNGLDPLNDVKRVLHAHNIPVEFSSKTLQEIKHFSNEVHEKDFHGRRDLRNLNLITIDGSTAKDFDDAIYVQSQTHGFRLYVAIADVSHYVKPGTALDQDAYERGTSVYFPNFVVPMLPEILSNELCSLKPHVPRLALVAEMDFDFHGEMLRSDFYEAVIESQARVTYGEAQEIVDGNHLVKFAKVEDDIKKAADLAKILMAKRFREGSLDLEIPEMEIVLDAAGNPVDLIRSERLFAHRLIEEMMLAANVAVAKFLSSKNIPAVYRIHDQPKATAIQMLERYLHNFGGKVRMEGGKLQKKLTRALEQFEGKPEAKVLHILTLRSMAQAKYSTENIGHFGLGFEFYTHFTSPIRRYPDLIVHRLVKNQILKNSPYRLMGEESLQTACVMLSACEQRSTKSERQFESIKKARFVQQHIGETFDGMISSVTKFGVFVLLRHFEVDGLIRLEKLSKEKLVFDEEHLCLRVGRGGKTFSIGDEIQIRVADANPELGQIDFEPADYQSSKSQSKDSGDRPHRHPAKKDHFKKSHVGKKTVKDSSHTRPQKSFRRQEKPEFLHDEELGHPEFKPSEKLKEILRRLEGGTSSKGHPSKDFKSSEHSGDRRNPQQKDRRRASNFSDKKEGVSSEKKTGQSKFSKNSETKKGPGKNIKSFFKSKKKKSKKRR